MNTTLCFLSDVLHLATFTSQYQKVLHYLVEKVVRLYNCQTCAVVLIDNKTEYLSIENGHGISYTYCKAYRRKLATGAIGELLWTGKPIWINDSDTDSQRAQEVQLERHFASCLCLQMAIDHQTIGFLHVDCQEKNAFQEEDLHVLQAFADMAALAIHKSRLHDDNIRLEIVDRETRLHRYGHFLERLNAAMGRVRDTHENFALLLLDVDNFKNIVNTYGLENAKELLAELGSLVKDSMRHIDSAGRYGFDEFILLRAHTNLEEALEFAEQLKRTVQDTDFTPEKIHTTISTGLAMYLRQGQADKHLVQTVKQALFEAQRAGRNQVFCFDRR